jgi:hypothetical protein
MSKTQMRMGGHNNPVDINIDLMEVSSSRPGFKGEPAKVIQRVQHSRAASEMQVSSAGSSMAKRF